MPFTRGRTLTTLSVTVFLIVMLIIAGSQGFFGNMFEGFGDMFGDMFGPVAETIQTGTGSSTRPVPTATVRR